MALRLKNPAALALLAICAPYLKGMPAGLIAQQQKLPASVTPVEIILPARIVAGRSTTAAILGADRKLASHVKLELSNGVLVETDATGRANFNAPAPGVLVAKAGAVSAATIVDAETDATAQRDIIVAPFASVRGQFSICGGGFHGNAEGDRVQINDEPALILAASPECIVVIPSPKTARGNARISVETDEGVRRAATTIVALEFEPPRPPLTSAKKGWLTVRARGTDERLHILVENAAPGVLRFEKGDSQDLLTSGGTDNVALIRVEAIRSGDFSFHARVLPPPDRDAARRFLKAAEPLAIGDVPRTLKNMENELNHRQPNSDKIRTELDRMLLLTSPSEFRTLLMAARSAL